MNIGWVKIGDGFELFRGSRRADIGVYPERHGTFRIPTSRGFVVWNNGRKYPVDPMPLEEAKKYAEVVYRMSLEP